MSEPESPREVLLFRVLAVAILAGSAAGAIWLFAVVPPADLKGVLLQAALFATIAGKYIIYWGLRPDSTLGVWGLALLAWDIDLLFGLALFAWLTRRERIPWVGPAFERAHERAAVLLEAYPRLKRMAFWGVIAFIMLPLPGTGAVTGSVAAQLLGLSRTYGLLAVAVGSGLVVLIYALIATFLGAQAENMLANPWVTGVSLVGLLALAWFGYQRVKRLLREA